VPILHAVAEHDHIVPYDAAKHLITKVGSQDKEEVMLKGGHVSLVAGAKCDQAAMAETGHVAGQEIHMSDRHE
jgi:poly(3-hydroxyalkanoate) synthetase